MSRLLADTRPLKESPEFRRLWWSSGLSQIGAQLSVVAVGLQVYELTGSTFSVGLLGLFALVPMVVLGLYGGALADTHDRRKLALLASLVMWVVSLGIAAQAWAQLNNVWVLYGLIAVQSGAVSVNGAARSAILPRLVRPELLPAANALNQLLWNVALMGGPLFGAALVAWVGFGPTYTIDVVTFTLTLRAVYLLSPVPPLRRDDPDAAPRLRGWASVAQGLRFLRGWKNVRMTFLLDMCCMVLAGIVAYLPAAGVVMIGGGATTTGALTAALAAGSALASLFSGPLGQVHRHGKALFAVVVGWGGCVVAFGVVLVMAGRTSPTHVIWWALLAAMAALAFAGAIDAIGAVFRSTMLQSATPDELRGRLQGIFLVVVAGGPRLGQLVSGADSAAVGEGWAAVIGGVACIAVGSLLVWRHRSFLAYDSRHPVP